MEYSKRKGNGLSGDFSGASNTLSYLSFDISLGFQMNHTNLCYICYDK